MQQGVDDLREKNSTIKKTCIISNTVYLLAHLAYLILFLVTQSFVLVYINILSIVVYSCFYILIHFKKYKYYAIGCGVEILSYMVIATILCGFDPGFHLCIIGLCIVAFYSSYFSKKTKMSILPLIWSILSLIIYVTLFFICQRIDFYYHLEYWASSTLFIGHALVVFAFITAYLWAFTRYVVNLEDRIKKESRTDMLTTVPNRYALFNYLESLTDKHKYLLAIMDIDDFKKINDKNGHLCGDYILRSIAEIAKDNSKADFVARYGGEEFIVISLIEDSVENTASKLDRIRETVLNHSFEFENKVIKPTITIGVSSFTDGMSVDEWIDKADSKLYEGKKSGKNKLVM